MTTGEIIAQSVESLWEKIIGFVPALVVAIIVLVLGWVLGNGLGSLVQKILEAIKIDNLANFLQGLVRHSLNASGLQSAESLSLITKWAVLIFAFLATLSQLGVAAAFVQDLFRALVAMLAIAGGIAFGMGGRE